MNDMRESEDRLRRLDFDSIFPETPESVHEAVVRAGVQIRRRQRARAARLRLALAAAAVLVVAAGVAAALWRLAPQRSDNVTAAPVEAEYENSTLTEVYSTKEDPCYHRDPSCPEIIGDAVALPLITAREFDKQPCRVCGEG